MKAPKVSKAVQTAFDRLMAAYPVRGDNPRTPALAVFDALVADGEDPEALVVAAGRFAAAMAAEKRERRMIPHTRTWLSQRRFDDYMQADVQASAGVTQPSPEHPLAWMVDEIGEASWRSWLGSLEIDAASQPMTLTARTGFQLDHIRKAGWIKQIEARMTAKGDQVQRGVIEEPGVARPALP